MVTDHVHGYGLRLLQLVALLFGGGHRPQFLADQSACCRCRQYVQGYPCGDEKKRFRWRRVSGRQPFSGMS